MSELLEALLQFFYPNQCLFCRAPLPAARRTPLCNACGRTLQHRQPIPLRPSQDAPPVGWACVLYTQSVRSVLHRFKFEGRAYYAETLAGIMAASLRRTASAEGQEAGYTGAYDLISWIPVSPWRLLHRGYDQSRLLAQCLARQLGLPLQRTLTKRIHNVPQSSLDAAGRRVNVKGVYRACVGVPLSGTRILLVDDIYTTGSTMGEALRVLQDAGAFAVGFCFARAGVHAADRAEGPATF